MTTNVNLQEKIFSDPIHGHIKLSPLCVMIVNTPQFERLRHIKQLGGVYNVYPGASHNRFEHSIGVCHLAGLMVRHLQSEQKKKFEKQLKEKKKELRRTTEKEEEVAVLIKKEKETLGIINKKDIVCVEIAGLCHDLGHGAFSHVFDNRFIPAIKGQESGSKESKWKHEHASLMMLDYMIEENGLRDAFRKEGLHVNLDGCDESVDDIDFIKKLIHAKDASVKKKTPRSKEKSFLYEIVSNDVNGIDVDKWDYFARDCHHLGIKPNFDHLRLINSARVITDIDQKPHICYRDKDKYNICNMFYTRNLLHRTAYQHKTVKQVEAMITDALVAVDDYLLFPSKEKTTTAKAAAAGRAEGETEKGSEPKRIELSETSCKMVELSKTVDDRHTSAYMFVHDGICTLIKLENAKFCALKEEVQESSNDPAQTRQAKFKKASDILDRVEKRQLYKYIGDLLWEKRYMDYKTENGVAMEGIKLENKISEEILTLCSQAADAKSLNLKEENVVVQIVCFDYGKEKEPLKNVLFWKKDNPDKAIQLEPEEISGMLPRTIKETRVFVYYNDHGVNDPDKKAKKVIAKAFVEFSKQRKSLSATVSTPCADNVRCRHSRLHCTARPHSATF